MPERVLLYCITTPGEVVYEYTIIKDITGYQIN